MTTGEKLKMLRNEKQLTVRELSKILNIGKSTLSNYENDTRSPNHEMLKKFSTIYDVSIDYLLGKTEIRNQSTVEDLVVDVLKKRGLIEDDGTIKDGNLDRIQSLLNRAIDIYEDMKK